MERRTSVIGGSRLENSAEHSWHLAVLALVLRPELHVDGRNLLAFVPALALAGLLATPGVTLAQGSASGWSFGGHGKYGYSFTGVPGDSAARRSKAAVSSGAGGFAGVPGESANSTRPSLA